MFTKKAQSRPALSLVELLITLVIFSVVALICVQVLINTMRSTKRIDAQVFLYTEAQTALDTLARAVEQNTIDYEAYFAREVLGESGWHTENYGLYALSFYDPGIDGPDDGAYSDFSGYYGIYCADGASSYPDDCPDETPDYSQADLDSGQHPFPDLSDYISTFSGDESSMNAFCDDGSTCTDAQHFVSTELILVNGAGDERTIFVLEDFYEGASDQYLSKVQMRGSDVDNDGIVDVWECMGRYVCEDTYTGSDGNPYAVVDFGDLEDTDNAEEPAEPDQNDFMPITPGALHIEEFYVTITPNEDPYRAYAEGDVQTQPQVTLVLTVTLSEEYGGALLGGAPSITLQRTVSTGVYSEVESYE